MTRRAFRSAPARDANPARSGASRVAGVQVDRTAVYPREVLKSSMRHNACGLILYHNHPSGVAEPSPSDIQLTGRIATLLEEVDVRLVDHVVVSADQQVSFAERGLL